MSTHRQDLISRCLVPPGKRLRLRDLDSRDVLVPEFTAIGTEALKKRARLLLEASRAELGKAQELLWASDAHSVLVVFQGMDAAGKDGMVKHVTSGMNPSACEVHAFKEPSAEELNHNFLWRYWQRVPARGRIGIFNRSYYEDVLVARVHPELLAAQRLPPASASAGIWARRYEDINALERHLARSGTVIIKFFLNQSQPEQKSRLLERLDDPHKRWKFSPADVAERAHWAEYMAAYQAMLNATSTAWAPWYAIPADHKRVARAVVASILCDRIGALGLKYPKVAKDPERELVAARRLLLRRPAARRR